MCRRICRHDSHLVDDSAAPDNNINIDIDNNLDLELDDDDDIACHHNYERLALCPTRVAGDPSPPAPRR